MIIWLLLTMMMLRGGRLLPSNLFRNLNLTLLSRVCIMDFSVSRDLKLTKMGKAISDCSDLNAMP